MWPRGQEGARDHPATTEDPVNTRTIAIIALIIAVILVLALFVF